LDNKGNILGQHKGTPFYTIGQRQGLGIAYKEPLYVTKIDVSKNVIVVGVKKDVLKKEFTADDLNWVFFKEPPKTLKVMAKIRYKHTKADATVEITGRDTAKVIFNKPQEAPTPGQAVVFYDSDIVLGGGWISPTGY